MWKYTRRYSKMCKKFLPDILCTFCCSGEYIVLCAFTFIVGIMAFCLTKADPLFSKLQDQLDTINSIMQPWSTYLNLPSHSFSQNYSA